MILTRFASRLTLGEGGGGRRKEGKGEVLIIIATLIPTNFLDESPSILVFGARKKNANSKSYIWIFAAEGGELF